MSRSQTWQLSAWPKTRSIAGSLVLVTSSSSSRLALRSLKRDRTEKRECYGRAARPTYWIVNLVDSQIEVSDLLIWGPGRAEGR